MAAGEYLGWTPNILRFFDFGGAGDWCGAGNYGCIMAAIIGRGEEDCPKLIVAIRLRYAAIKTPQAGV